MSVVWIPVPKLMIDKFHRGEKEIVSYILTIYLRSLKKGMSTIMYFDDEQTQTKCHRARTMQKQI